MIYQANKLGLLVSHIAPMCFSQQPFRTYEYSTYLAIHK